MKPVYLSMVALTGMLLATTAVASSVRPTNSVNSSNQNQMIMLQQNNDQLRTQNETLSAIATAQQEQLKILQNLLQNQAIEIQLLKQQTQILTKLQEGQKGVSRNQLYQPSDSTAPAAATPTYTQPY